MDLLLPTTNSDDKRPGRQALLLIDWINDFAFAEGRDLARHALPASRRCVELKQRAKAANIPIIYVNDNFGCWRSNFDEVVAYCLARAGEAREVFEPLLPAPDDYFVLKPMHSGFYLTPLELLLSELGVQTLILTGLAGNICVLFTAHDAHMRKFDVTVPSDCVASNRIEDNAFALKQLQQVIGATVKPSDELWLYGGPDPGGPRARPDIVIER